MLCVGEFLTLNGKKRFFIPILSLIYIFYQKSLKLALKIYFSVQNKLLIVCAFHTEYFVVKTLILKGSRIQRIFKKLIFLTRMNDFKDKGNICLLKNIL